MSYLLSGNNGQGRVSGINNIPTPSLDLPFAEFKSLVDRISGKQLFTFTRSTSGTFFDATGVLRSAPINLLLRSEEIGVSPWATNNAGATTYTADATIAPSRLMTADRVTATADFAGPNQFISATSGLSYAFSFYVKAVTPGSLDVIRIECFSGRQAQFNITTRVFSGVNAAITPSFIALDDGWVRVQCLFTAPSTGSLAVAIYANTSADFYLWGTQLEQSSTVGDYVRTTTVANSGPRFDHNPATGESLGLLVEEPRTNSIRNNTMVGAVAGTPGALPTNWGSFFSPSGLTRTIVGTGTQNGINYIDIKITGTPNTTNEITIYLDIVSAASQGQAWTFSTWISVVGGSTSNIATLSLRNFQLNAGSYVRENSTNIISSISTSLIRVSNLTSSFGSGADGIQPVISMYASVAGTPIDITLRIGLPQLEQGAFATSVIPTTTTAATRSADVASITGANFSSWYRVDEGTVFADYGPFNAPSSSSINPGVWTLNSTNISDNVIDYFNGSVTTSVFRVNSLGSGQVYITGNGNLSKDVRNKSASAYKQNDFARSLNGLPAAVDDNGLLPSVSPTFLNLGTVDAYGVKPLNGPIRRFTYWPERLENYQLQRVTR